MKTNPSTNYILSKYKQVKRKHRMNKITSCVARLVKYFINPITKNLIVLLISILINQYITLADSSNRYPITSTDNNLINYNYDDPPINKVRMIDTLGDNKVDIEQVLSQIVMPWRQWWNQKNLNHHRQVHNNKKENRKNRRAKIGNLEGKTVFKRKKRRHRMSNKIINITKEFIESGGWRKNFQYPNLDQSSPTSMNHALRPMVLSQMVEHRNFQPKPNIILILTDDQDVELGSLNYMPLLDQVFRTKGVFLKNAYVTTPVCCPSRSSLLTGVYAHNHHVLTNNMNCSSPQWQSTYETVTFANYLQKEGGYTTGFFGKYLNEYNGSYVPPGWGEWAGLVRNTRYYNYTLNHNGQLIKHGDNYERDYLTDLVANDTIAFIRKSKMAARNIPVLAVMSMPAPHGTEDSAPQYSHLFSNVTSHRTPSWNYAPNLDKEWILQRTGKMEPIHIAFTDMLQRKRLQTLQSVDKAIKKISDELESMGELENTYMIYTSDHGYHLGQYGLIKGKSLPYEFDIKVPLFIRGPGIPVGKEISGIALNIDIAPTILEMAGVENKYYMDGRSLLPLLKDPLPIPSPNATTQPWRDTFLVERGKITEKMLKRIQTEQLGLKHVTQSADEESAEAEAHDLGLLSKSEWVREECRKPAHSWPCKRDQKWFCKADQLDPARWRMYKCRYFGKVIWDKCVCFPVQLLVVPQAEKFRQKKFLKKHATKWFRPKFLEPKHVIESTNRIDSLQIPNQSRHHPSFFRRRKKNFEPNHQYEAADWSNLKRVQANKNEEKDSMGTLIKLRHKRNCLQSLNRFRHRSKERGFHQRRKRGTKRCRVSSNFTVVCQDDAYDDLYLWEKHKDFIRERIQAYKTCLKELKKIRDILKRRKSSSTIMQLEITSLTPQPRNLFLNNEDSISTNISTKSYEPPSYNRINKNLPLYPTSQLGGDKLKKIYIKNDAYYYYGQHMEIYPNCDCDQNEELMKDEMPYFQNASNINPPIHFQESSIISDFRNKRSISFEAIYTMENRRAKRHRKRKKKEKKDGCCNEKMMNCFQHDNYHWKTPPLWTLGPFCFCQNANNQSFSCLRTINATDNFLYCEFVTGFVSYYDLLSDPYQLHNVVSTLTIPTLLNLHNRLIKLKSCRGSQECTIHSRSYYQNKHLHHNDDWASLYPYIDQLSQKRNALKNDIFRVENAYHS